MAVDFIDLHIKGVISAAISKGEIHLREVHIVKVRSGFINKSIDHTNRSEVLDVFATVELAVAAAQDFLSSNAAPVRLATPVLVNQ